MLWHSRSPDDTTALARALAAGAPGQGGVVALVGELGTGKTVFAKGVAAELGIPAERVASPTFVIAHEYDAGPLRLVHADLYRVESAEALEASGWLDWLGPGVLLIVEWADRFRGELPPDHLEVRLARSAGEPQLRSVEARATGRTAVAWLERWARVRTPLTA
jgi:tRNA threonylcarbamoyladenosine biosynthesis protein TsaE